MQKIAIIEDDIALQLMYKAKFELENFQVQAASNGRAGLELTEQFRPDLILLDLMMPEMNGDEMLEKMRATSWGSSIRVIILTNISKSEAPTVLRFLSVDRYIVKAHTTPAEILRIAKEVLGTK